MRTVLWAAVLASGIAAPAFAGMSCDAFVALDTDGQERAVAAAQAEMAAAEGGMMAAPDPAAGQMGDQGGMMAQGTTDQGMMAANDPAAATPYDIAMAVADMCAGNPQMSVADAMGMAPQ